MRLTVVDLVTPARLAPQSLRRLFHDETSAEPDPFQSFAHQQPPTPQTSEGSSSVEQVGRFDTPPEEEFLDDPDSPAFDGSTIRQKPPSRPLSIITNSQAPPAMASSSSNNFDTTTLATLIARTDESGPIPSTRQIKSKMSFDTLTSAATSRSQPEIPRKEAFTGRRPGGSVSEGLKGFQFPLVTKSVPTNPVKPITPGRPQAPQLQRMHSAAPTIPLPSDSPSRQIPTQISLVPPARPPMMRQASVAVMEGRAQTQAQALAVAQAQDGPLSPTKSFAASRPGLSGPPIMMRSRSGSRVDTEGGIGLRDLLKVCRRLPSSVINSSGLMKWSPTVPEMPDLLPPSPTVSSTPQKFFPTPSPLAVAPPMAPNLSSLSSTTVSASNPVQRDFRPAYGPPVKPLDFSRMEADEVFATLEGVVEDMKVWLGCVEDGLGDLLTIMGNDGFDGEVASDGLMA